MEAAHSPACRAAQLLQPHLSTLAPLVLGAFGDKHAGSHASLWDMVLNFLKAFPKAWHQVDVRKAFLPKLYSFLRSVQLQHPTISQLCMAGAAVPIRHGIGAYPNSGSYRGKFESALAHLCRQRQLLLRWGGGFTTSLHLSQPKAAASSCNG